MRQKYQLDLHEDYSPNRTVWSKSIVFFPALFRLRFHPLISGVNAPFYITLVTGILMIITSLVFVVRALFSIHAGTSADDDDDDQKPITDYDVIFRPYAVENSPYLNKDMKQRVNLDTFVTSRSKLGLK